LPLFYLITVKIFAANLNIFTKKLEYSLNYFFEYKIFETLSIVWRGHTGNGGVYEGTLDLVFHFLLIAMFKRILNLYSVKMSIIPIKYRHFSSLETIPPKSFSKKIFLMPYASHVSFNAYAAYFLAELSSLWTPISKL
jgi:hypothetical protein